MKNDPATLAKLLRAIADADEAKERKTDVIFNAAAEWLEMLASFTSDDLIAFGERKH